jgi:hypothetical protein
VGLFLTRSVPVICFLMLLLRVIVASPIEAYLRPKSEWPSTRFNSIPLKTGRARIEAQLDAQPVNHLVLVLYNLILIMCTTGCTTKRRLIDYFKDRHVWLVEPANERPRLTKYPAPPRANGE